MADLGKVIVVRCFTTPCELRDLADRMEKFWDEVKNRKDKAGVDLHVCSWTASGVEIEFIIRKESMP